MAEKGIKSARIVLLLVLLAAARIWGTAAFADDPETLRLLPGDWVLYGDAGDEEDGAAQTEMAVLSLEEDGRLSLRCNGEDGSYAYSCEGAWSFAFVPDGMDYLTLRFTAADDPLLAGGADGMECVYDVYTESWVENDTEFTALLLEETEDGGASPFEELTGYGSAALYRKRGPNMRVVNCKDFVSLRAKRDQSSARLAKVPLGALVLAYPEAGEENGFIQCVYRDEYGFILSKYLQPVE